MKHRAAGVALTAVSFFVFLTFVAEDPRRAANLTPLWKMIPLVAACFGMPIGILMAIEDDD